jgi:hypothetical protein
MFFNELVVFDAFGLFGLGGDESGCMHRGK